MSYYPHELKYPCSTQKTWKTWQEEWRAQCGGGGDRDQRNFEGTQM